MFTLFIFNEQYNNVQCCIFMGINTHFIIIVRSSDRSVQKSKCYGWLCSNAPECREAQIKGNKHAPPQSSLSLEEKCRPWI